MMSDVINAEDLEDGEIESDGEELAVKEEPIEEDVQVPNEDPHKRFQDVAEPYHQKTGKKKKSKNKSEKNKEKNKKKRKLAMNNQEDDFAGNIEKAIRKAMNKPDETELYSDEFEEKRKNKKRKKYENKDGVAKKRRKQDYLDVDESEMMCVRGASPVQKDSASDDYHRDNDASDYSGSSDDSRGHPHNNRNQRKRQQRERKGNNKNDRDRRRGGAHPMQDPDGVCLYFMQGKCHKGDDCMYSHDALPPRKMELCKFYLMECCAKRDKCLYMHADFPCKYYHTGLPCIFKDECKFAHGGPLTENLKNIIVKHIESAPKEILGDFPRLNREGALKMIQTTQLKLMQQYPDAMENQEKAIPSLFDINIGNPSNNPDFMSNMNNMNDKQHKISTKVRQSRWQNDNPASNFSNMNSMNNCVPTSNVLHIKNLTGVLTPRQISDLSKMGIENLDQLGQLTVLQLNSIGISLKQITEIQLNTMSIQKLGLINSNSDQHQQNFISPSKDMDFRVPPVVPPCLPQASSDLSEKDVDMRFHQPSVIEPKIENATNFENDDKMVSKDMIDIDQYTKDALKFAAKDADNISIKTEQHYDDDISSNVNMETKDVDHRVIPFSDNVLNRISPLMSSIETNVKTEMDTDIRFIHPEPIFKSPAKRTLRRSTTDDDEENNLLIDEKWYSSDDEKSAKRKSPDMSPQQTSVSPIPTPHVIEPSAVLRKLGDLSKIDISEEVTKLLNTMKNNAHEQESKLESIENTEIVSRDPRSRRSPEFKNSPDHKEPKLEVHKSTAKKPRVSIYECVDGEPTDGRRRSDVDLRQPDYKVPSFGDTDFRQSTSGDIDFRLALPFKAIPNYTPASEIDGSINSHPPISYKLLPIDIPRPDYSDIKNSTAKSQALSDPRLRKVFRLSVEESNSDSEKSTKPATAAVAPTAPRIDPRRKPKDNDTSEQDQKPNIQSLDMQMVIQNSQWYKDLSSTQKIFVNQQIATVTGMIKMYQQDKTPGKTFDLTPINNNAVLVNIFTNLGVTLGDNAEFQYLPKPKEGLLKTPLGNFSQNVSPFGMNSSSMDNSNMHMLNMPPMNMSGAGGPMSNMGMANMHRYNQGFPDPRGGPTPGLLGIAPNIPHNFNNQFSGPPNQFGNMAFNGPMNNFGNMEGHRFPNRGGHRGRGNEGWNRGGGGRGRKNFNERSGNWKNK